MRFLDFLDGYETSSVPTTGAPSTIQAGSLWGCKLSIAGAKTGTYAVVDFGGTDTVITASGAAGSYTISFPALTTNFGRLLIVKRTDQTLANAITLDPNSTETIDSNGTLKLMTKDECAAFIGGGGSTTTWRKLWHYIPSVWTAYVPTIAGCGTVTVNEAFWRRVGDSIQIRGSITCGTVTAAAVKISLPTGLTGICAFSKVLMGSYGSDYTGAAMLGITPTMLAADTSNIQLGRNNSTSIFTALLGNAILSNGSIFTFEAQVPITNWEG